MSELPEASEPLLGFGVMLRTLDRMIPGFLDEYISDLEDDAFKAEIVKLRGPKHEPIVKEKLARTLFWAKTVRLVHRATGSSAPTGPPPAPQKSFWKRR